MDLTEGHVAVCPHLPIVEDALGPWVTRRHGGLKGPEFYFDALRYSQWLWSQRKPAQAILQLNKAWMADLEHHPGILSEWPSPYLALVWMIRESSRGTMGFFGNPVRHFQHLASRMSGERAETRTWRAWLCFHLAEQTLGVGYPRDGDQLAREGLWIPPIERAMEEVSRRGWSGEAEAANVALSMSGNPRR